jgi:hypothetical protein
VTVLTEDSLIKAMSVLGWDTASDDIVIEIGGVATSGIKQPPDANPKWAKQFGTTTYQSDAFIVIKNKTRTPFEPSKPNNEQST